MFDAKKYWDNRLRKNYNLVGVGDITLGTTYNKWSYKITKVVLKRILKKYFTATNCSNFVDIGSGTGFIVNILKEFSGNVTGIDISPVAITNLITLFPECKFYEVDVGNEAIPISDSSISCCTAASVFYHIIDDNALNKALQNIYRILCKDGILIFSDNFIHQRQYEITHQKCRTLQDWEQLLTSNGFEVIERLPNYVLMNDPVDSQNGFYIKLWNGLTTLARKVNFLDRIIWPSLYPIELILTAIIKESPAQEFMICRARK